MKKFIIFSFALLMFSCQDIVDGIDQNPNSITANQIEPILVLPGAMVANTLVQIGHLQRIAGLYSGHYVAYQSLYLNIYSYNLTSEESQSTWDRAYINTIPQVRFIQEAAAGDNLLKGIAKVIEANCIGTIASYFGNVPYSEINNNEIDDPKFDNQVDVFNALIVLLDNAISDLNAASSRSLSEDIYYGGNKTKWTEAAHTLKARFYMYLKDYGNAYASAQSGISTSANDMLFTPVGEPGVSGSKNTYWTILNGSRTGDMGSRMSHLQSLLDPAGPDYRGNAKTDETARNNYYEIKEASAGANQGVVAEYEPQPIITYRENLLILAEAGMRTQGFQTGLDRLNEFREYLNNGGWINDNFINDPFSYMPYETADFEPGGIENEDGVSADNALLREILEERYVSGYMSIMAFDDARRLRKSDSGLAVNFPLNTPTANAHPERMIYPSSELTTNSNAPDEPGLTAKTPVNQ